MKKMIDNIRDVIEILETSMMHGKFFDVPERVSYIKISDTLAKKMVSVLESMLHNIIEFDAYKVLVFKRNPDFDDDTELYLCKIKFTSKNNERISVVFDEEIMDKITEDLIAIRESIREQGNE